MFIEYKVGNKPWEADKNHIFEYEGDPEDEDSYKRVRQVDSTSRNYQLFGLLAGVRCEGPRAKGIPENVSKIIAQSCEEYGEDGHSHSYSSLEEFEAALRKCIGEQERWDYKLKATMPAPNQDELNELLSEAEPVGFYEFILNRDVWYSYPNLLAYCKKQVELKRTELELEKHLLNVDGPTNVECRLVYFFDN